MKVMVGVADAVVIAAVRVAVAEDCAGVRVRVDGLAVTPAGSPEMETEMEPLKELREVAETVMALLVLPALSESEPGETARVKSAAGLGGGLPQVVNAEMAARAAMTQSALARVRMAGYGGSAGVTVSRPERAECHRGVIVCSPAGLGLVGIEMLGFAKVENWPGRGSDFWE